MYNSIQLPQKYEEILDFDLVFKVIIESISGLGSKPNVGNTETNSGVYTDDRL